MSTARQLTRVADRLTDILISTAYEARLVEGRAGSSSFSTCSLFAFFSYIEMARRYNRKLSRNTLALPYT